MKRRTVLKSMLAGAGAAAVPAAAQTAKTIQLHCDLNVDPAKEAEVVKHFVTNFRPTAAKQQGYIDVKLVKLRKEIMGKVGGNFNYRFVLTFQSEELRQKWIASADHQKVWPPIENGLRDKNYTVILYDVN